MQKHNPTRAQYASSVMRSTKCSLSIMPITEKSGDGHKTLSDALTPEGSTDLHYFCLMITGV